MCGKNSRLFVLVLFTLLAHDLCADYPCMIVWTIRSPSGTYTVTTFVTVEDVNDRTRYCYSYIVPGGPGIDSCRQEAGRRPPVAYRDCMHRWYQRVPEGRPPSNISYNLLTYLLAMLHLHQSYPQLNFSSSQCGRAPLHSELQPASFLARKHKLVAVFPTPCVMALDALPLPEVFSGLSVHGQMLGLSLSGLQFAHNNTVFANLLDFGVEPAAFALGVVLQQTTTGFHLLVTQHPVNAFNVAQLLESALNNTETDDQVPPVQIQATTTISNEEMAAITVWPGARSDQSHSIFQRLMLLLLICIGCGCCGGGGSAAQ